MAADWRRTVHLGRAGIVDGNVLWWRALRKSLVHSFCQLINGTVEMSEVAHDVYPASVGFIACSLLTRNLIERSGYFVSQLVADITELLTTADNLKGLVAVGAALGVIIELDKGGLALRLRSLVHLHAWCDV